MFMVGNVEKCGHFSGRSQNFALRGNGTYCSGADAAPFDVVLVLVRVGDASRR